MRKLTVGLIALIAVAAMPQDRPARVVVAPSTASAVGPQWDKGVVEGGTYRNPSLGIEITPPPGIEFGTPELKGNPGTVPLLVTVTAVEPTTLTTFFRGRKVMAYYSDALAYYPHAQRSSSAYLRKVVQANERGGQGFRSTGDSSDEIFGGLAFARQDFSNDTTYEVVLVKSCDAQALVFIFAASDHDGVNKLIAATQLKVDLGRSGCGSKGSGANQR